MHTNHNRRMVLGTLAAAAAGAASPWARAQSAYPSKPIRVIIPYAAGGSTDATVRKITSLVNIGQPFVVDNKPGAGTQIGTQAIIEAPPDGHTLGFVTAALSQNQVQMTSWNIDPLKQLVPISAAVSVPVVLFVNPAKHNVRTLAEFIRAVKANPSGGFFASSGGSDVLPMHNFNTLAGTKLEIVNFKGESNVIVAMMRGDADIAMSALGSVRQQIQAGTLRALAVTSIKRSPMFPDVPTVDEAGVKGYEFSSWSGFVAPAGTPRPIVDQLNRAITGVIRTPEIQKFIADLGNFTIPGTPEEFGQLISAEIQKWNAVAKAAGFTPA
jgi:tripartite-type tricarboxylate transporter receptor subunit TctC